MKYRVLFEKVQRHITTQCHWKCSVKTGRPLSVSAAKRFKDKTGQKLPDGLVALFQEMGVGPEMYWCDPSDVPDAPCCNMRFPTIKKAFTR